MIVDLNYASNIFNKYFPDVSVYYHPKYINNERLNHVNSKPRFFIFEEENQVFYHAFVENSVDINGMVYRDIQAPNGYGGPLIVGEKDFQERAVNYYLKWASEQNYIIEFMKFHPLLKSKDYYGEKLFNRKTIVINLEQQELTLSYKSRIRRKINKAKREKISTVFSKEERYIKAFISIYHNLMLSKKADTEYFFTEQYITTLIKEEFVQLVSAVDREGHILGGIIFFQNGYISDYHLSASNDIGKKFSVTSLIIHDYAMYAKMNKMKYLYLGGGYNTEIENSLYHFKQGFSDRELDYCIGYYVHNHNIYNKLKLEHNIDENNHRIIFYR